jgi:hypothetical protein
MEGPIVKGFIQKHSAGFGIWCKQRIPDPTKPPRIALELCGLISFCPGRES